MKYLTLKSHYQAVKGDLCDLASLKLNIHVKVPITIFFRCYTTLTANQICSILNHACLDSPSERCTPLRAVACRANVTWTKHNCMFLVLQQSCIIFNLSQPFHFTIYPVVPCANDQSPLSFPMWVNCRLTVYISVSHALQACQEVTARYQISETRVQGENVPIVDAVCIFLRTAGTLNWSLSTNLQPRLPPSLPPTPPHLDSLHASSCSLFPSFGCILHPLPFNSWHGDKKREEMEESGKASLEGVVGRRGGRGWWRNLGKESVSVAPTEIAVGQRAEIGLLVRGYSWKVCRSHWAGTVADKGTLVLMKSSPRSYQSMRVLVVGFCLCACVGCLSAHVWMLSPSWCCEFVSIAGTAVDLVCSLLMHMCSFFRIGVLCISARVHVCKSLWSLCALLKSLSVFMIVKLLGECLSNTFVC